MIKKIFRIGLIVLALALLAGCGPKGGTIIIQHTGTSDSWGVLIKD